MAHASRMCALVEQLQKRLAEGGQIERRELSQQLLHVSRCVDHAVASQQKPLSPQMVLHSFKQFAKFKEDLQLRPSVMVLLLSVKSACLSGWFKKADVDELLSHFNTLFEFFWVDGEKCKPPQQLAPNVLSLHEMSAEVFIPLICERYYPRLALISVIMSLTVKPGYEVRVGDFMVNSQLAPFTKLRLFVAQMDNTETSACIITPPLISFLLNGKGVERRMFLSASPDAGPQLPTDVTQYLRIGNNVIQAVGESPAHYMVAVALMGTMSWNSTSVQLENYVVPSPSTNTDDEVIEGGSRVSLRCPVSLKRIICPVKGVSCKHHQCFDYDSYMEINERRPAWRCPSCNTHVNCSELRLDQHMKQILNEVEEKYSDVIINQDGSWIPALSPDEIDAIPCKSNVRSLGVGGVSDDGAMQGSIVDLPKPDDVARSIVDLSDDDEIELIGQVERTISPRGVNATHFGKTTTSTSEVEDRKPDLRAIPVNDTFASIASLQSPAAVCNPNRERLGSPCASFTGTEAQIQVGFSAAQTRALPDASAGIRSMADPSVGVRQVIQNSGASTHLWSAGNVTGYTSSLATAGQPPGNRFSSGERPAYGNRTPVVQALPAPSHFHNGSTRTASGPSIQAGNSGIHTGNGFIPDAGQTGPSLPASVQPENDASLLYHPDIHITNQQLQELRQQILHNPNSARVPMQVDAAQRNQRRGPRNGVGVQMGGMQNGLGLPREAQMQQLGIATQPLAGQGQQNVNQPVNNVQYSLGAPNSSGSSVRQDYWQNQRLVQQAHHPVQSGPISRGPVSALSQAINSSALNPPAAVTSGNSPHIIASRLNSHVLNSISPNPITNTSTDISGSTGNPSNGESWFSATQASNWRPAARMRGSIGGGLASGGRGGVQPAPTHLGSLSRTRGPTSPNLVSSFSNVLVPQYMTNLPTSSDGTRATTPGASCSATPVDSNFADSLYNTQGPILNGGTLADPSWPPLELGQLDGSGSQDVESWIEDYNLSQV